MNYCFIMRGTPGSGKSTVAKFLLQTIGTHMVKIHCTDDFFINCETGQYEFDKDQLYFNHKRNFENFCQSLKNNVSVVIVDNTNTTKKEFQKYVNEVKKYENYILAFIEMPIADVGISMKRNKHNVPKEVIETMIQRWQPSQ